MINHLGRIALAFTPMNDMNDLPRQVVNSHNGSAVMMTWSHLRAEVARQPEIDAANAATARQAVRREPYWWPTYNISLITALLGRQIVSIPVLGMTEARLMTACLRGAGLA